MAAPSRILGTKPFGACKLQRMSLFASPHFDATAHASHPKNTKPLCSVADVNALTRLFQTEKIALPRTSLPFCLFPTARNRNGKDNYCLRVWGQDTVFWPLQGIPRAMFWLYKGQAPFVKRCMRFCSLSIEGCFKFSENWFAYQKRRYCKSLPRSKNALKIKIVEIADASWTVTKVFYKNTGTVLYILMYTGAAKAQQISPNYSVRLHPTKTRC